MEKTNEKQVVTKADQKAFQLLTIARFILARTPMVLGYAEHNQLIAELSMMTKQISNEFSDIDGIVESQEWAEIQKVLHI